MIAANPTFSDAWYQVADARVALLPTVKAQFQRYRGQPWMVLEDAYSHKFYRVRPQAWAFLRALNMQRTVDETWRALAEAQPEHAPGQDEVVRLLSQLHLASLLAFDGEACHEAIDERGRLHRRREATGRLMSFLSVKLPLLNPDRWLDRLRPLVLALTGPLGWAVWGAVVSGGALAAISHHDALSQQGQGLLALANLPWLYASLTLVKVLHEFNHAFVCKRYGGRVPVMGVMFLILTPLPYVDASASWSMRSKWQRAHVGAAGVLAELFLAALGALVWAHTAPGLLNSVAFNVMVVGSVSSLLFNGNPLVRFDAYYVLIDLIEVPNLYQKAQAQWLHWGSRYLLGNRAGSEPAGDGAERVGFALYGAATFFYRTSVAVSIALYVLDQWFAVGLLLAVMTTVGLLVMPLRRLVTALTSPALARSRPRALLTVGVIAAAAWLAVAVVPLPYHVRLPGIVQAHRSSLLYAETPGVLTELSARDGQRLHAGDAIARLSDPDLELAIVTTREQIAETEALLRQALSHALPDVEPLQRRVAGLGEKQGELEALARRLDIHAAHDGEWVAPTLHERQSAWVERSQPLGELVDRSRLRFAAVLSQSEAAELFGLRSPHAELRLMDAPGDTIAMAAPVLLPYQRDKLMSPVLGFFGGGHVPVRSDDASGTSTTEPFFELHAEFAQALPPTAYHGLSGELRLALPPRPLLARARIALRQLLQTRYDL